MKALDEEKLVTVLMTVYNRLSVKNTIESILGQTFKDFTLLIVDNASTDGTYELLLDYQKKDDRIEVVRNDRNRGQTYSLHKGMELAKGKYIARIDADDLMHKERLVKQVEFLEKNEDYGVCGSWVQFITDDDKLAFVIKTTTSDLGLRTMQRVACGIYHPAVMMRKRVLEQNGIHYDPNIAMAEDYDMWRQILQCSKGINLPEVLTYYRRGDSNDSEKHRTVTHREDFMVRKKVCSEEFPGKEYMTKIIATEEKNKKHIYEFFNVYRLYKKYLKKNISKTDSNYQIIIERIKSRMLGEFVVYNKAMWSCLLNKMYQFIRKMKYRSIERKGE